MRGALWWLVELACRPFDAAVCRVANETDEPEPSASDYAPDLRATA